MTYTPALTVAVAGQRDFTVPFPFINRSHVEVLVNGIRATVLEWPDSTTLRLSGPLVGGESVVIRRNTPIDTALVQFQNGAILTAEDLNLATQQSLLKQQEVSYLYESILSGAQSRLASNLGLVVAPEDVADALAQEVLATDVLNTFEQGLTDIAATANQAATAVLQVNALADTVAENTAAVVEVASAIAGVEARYGINLDVNGYVTGFVQNNDGQSGSFVILADKFAVVAPGGGTPVVPFSVDGGGVKINGDLVVNGTISTNKLAIGSVSTDRIAANAVTNGASGYTAGGLSLTSSWQTAASASLTATGGVMRVDFSAAFFGINVEVIGDAVIQYRIKRGSTVIHTDTYVSIPSAYTAFVGGEVGSNSVTVNQSASGTFSWFFVDDTPGTGSVTYTVELRIASGSPANCSVSARRIALLELKK